MAMNEYDIDLVTSAKNGSTQAFEELYERYYGKIFALARMTVKNEADAEDILQQAFISAWRNMHSLTSPEAFSTWLQKITLNQCYALLRKKNITVVMDAESETEDFSEEISEDFLPAVYAEQDDLRLRLGKIIDNLSDVQKQTIVLYYFNEQKVEEIAYIMECTVGTVKSRLFLARKAIRTEVEEEERKSGQKFYGIAGIPVLSLGDLLAQQFGAQALSGEISSGILAALIKTISQEAISGGAAGSGGIAGSSGTTAGSVSTGTVTAAAGTTAGMSAGIKTTILSAIIVTCIGLGYGGALFIDNALTNNDPSNKHNGSRVMLPDEPATAPEQPSTPAPTSTPVPEPTPEPDVEPEPSPEPVDQTTLGMQLYGDLLVHYREFIIEAYEENRRFIHSDENFPEELSRTLFISHDLGPFEVSGYYYSFYDLNGDGIPELLLTNRQKSYGFGFHTWVDGAIYTPEVNFGGRSGFNILRDGYIIIGGPSGADGGNSSYYRMSADGRDLEFIVGLYGRWGDYTAGELLEAIRYDSSPGIGVTITKEEFNEIVRRYSGELIDNRYEFDETDNLIWLPLTEVP